MSPPNRKTSLVVLLVVAALVVAQSNAIESSEHNLGPHGRRHRSPLPRAPDGATTIHLAHTQNIDIHQHAPRQRSVDTTGVGGSQAPSDGLVQVLVHLKPPLTQDVIKAAEAYIGTSFDHYVPNNAFLLVATPAQADRAATAPRVSWVGSVPAAAKVDPALFAGSPTARDLENKPAVTLAVRLVPSSHGSAAAVSDLAEAVAAHGGHLQSVSDAKVMVTTQAAAVGRTVAALAASAHVHFVQEREVFTMRNKYAAGLTQSNTAGTTPIFDRGLDGTGQIVGCSDTGLDASHCFFHDPDVAVPYDTVSTTHRKIVAYFTDADDDRTDDVGGHGTHVTGSIAGAALYPQDPAAEAAVGAYNGMAPGARLVFTDVGLAGKEDGLQVPADLNADLFPEAYQAGARIHTNSWGSSSTLYTVSAMEVDEFTHDHQDMLVLFAAGNDGDGGLFTVGSPSTAKNMIAVGAASSNKASWGDVLAAGSFSITSADAGGIDSTGALAQFSGSVTTPITATAAISTASTDGCNALGSSVAGKIVVVDRGTCDFVTKAANADAAGVAGLLVANTEAGDPIVMGGEGSYGVPMGMISLGLGAQLKSALGHGTAVTLTLGAAPRPDLGSNPHYSKENVAYFSARGPCPDLRIKPDLMAPGEYIWSSRSNGPPETVQCSLDDIMPLQGTSMASPVMAGVAALARQYFADGYYPSGVATPSDALAPSGALLKAVLINSGVRMAGMVNLMQRTDTSELWARLADVEDTMPSFFEGFGRVQLDRVLPFDDDDDHDDDRPFSLWVADVASGDGLSTGDGVTYCFDAPAGHAFKATLVWTDPASSLISAINLVNDLDLVVDTPDGVYSGNGALFSDNRRGPLQYDPLNNVEQVNLTLLTSGRVVVHVAAAAVPVGGSQSFALAVTAGPGLRALTADEAAADDSCSVRCVNGCGAAAGAGTCVDGLCACAPGFAGADCSQTIRSIDELGIYNDGTLTPYAWDYYAITGAPGGDNAGLDLVFSISRTSALGDPDFYIKAGGQVPTLANHDYANTESDTSGITDHQIRIPADDVEAATYVLGAYGYCCDDSSFVFAVSYEEPPADTIGGPGADGTAVFNSKFTMGLLVGVGVVGFVLTLGVCLVSWRRERRAASGATSYAVMSE